jgi:MFS family permease
MRVLSDNQTGPIVASPLRPDRVLGTGALVGVSLGFSFSALGPLAETLAHAYGVDVPFVGLIVGALALSHCLAQIPSGRLVDRFGAQTVGTLGLVIVVLANVSALATPSPALAVGLRLLAGVGTGLGFIAGTQYVRARGDLAQGIFGGAVIAGQGIGIALMPILDAPFGWRGPWLVTALLGSAALVLFITTHVAPPPPPAPSGRNARPLFRDPGLYRLATMYMAGMGLTIVMGTWIVVLLTRNAHLDPRLAGGIGSLALLLGVVSRPLGGWVLRHHPHHVHRACAASLLLGAAGTVAIALAQSAPQALAGATAVGLAGGITYAPAFAGAARRWPSAPGTAVSLVNALGLAVVVVGTTLVGVAFGPGSTGQLGFLGLALLWLVPFMVFPAAEDVSGRA